jgi:hypothetical protein
MHPRTTELLQYIDQRTAELRAAFDAVPADRRSVRPAPDRWSAAEVVHHVSIVERRLTVRLRALVEEARTRGPDLDESPILEMLQTKRVEVRDTRIVTGESGQPRDTNVDTVWTDFDVVRSELREVIAAGDGLALSEVSAPHPALGPMTGYAWIAFIGSHAARHAAQIREQLS